MPPFLAPLLAVLVAVAPAASDAQPLRTILQTPLDTLPRIASGVDSGRPVADMPPLPPDSSAQSSRPALPTATRTVSGSPLDSTRFWTIRVGLHASAEDIGLAAGAGLRAGILAGGFDAWIRPGVFTREVRTSPGRRAQYKEILYGAFPWIALDIPLFPLATDVEPLRVGALTALELSTGVWYGTIRRPESEAVFSAGGRITIPPGLQLEIRRSFDEGSLGHWRGSLAWEI